jgi:type II secretory pathway pseudopilin PulG
MESSIRRGFGDSPREAGRGSRGRMFPVSPGWWNMRRNHDTGFTLVEMAMLLVILGALFTIVVVGTTRMGRSSRLAGAVNTLVGDLRYARMLSTTEGKQFTVQFHTGGYTVARVTPSSVVIRRSCPTGVTCSASGTATFYAWGLTTPATITLANTGGSKVLQLTANGNITR